VTIDVDPFFGTFGLSAPTSVDVTFQIDDSLAPVVIIPPSPGNFATPLYGYDRSAISVLSVSFGTGTWTDADLQSRVPVVGFAADVWFDGPLADGATPNTWMYLANGLGSIQFGGGACGFPCFLVSSADVSGDGGGFAFGLALSVSISAVQTAIPAPTPLVIFGLGIAALGPPPSHRLKRHPPGNQPGGCLAQSCVPPHYGDRARPSRPGQGLTQIPFDRL
jgi:hypothetical protein